MTTGEDHRKGLFCISCLQLFRDPSLQQWPKNFRWPVEEHDRAMLMVFRCVYIHQRTSAVALDLASGRALGHVDEVRRWSHDQTVEIAVDYLLHKLNTTENRIWKNSIWQEHKVEHWCELVEPLNAGQKAAPPHKWIIALWWEAKHFIASASSPAVARPELKATKRIRNQEISDFHSARVRLHGYLCICRVLYKKCELNK